MLASDWVSLTNYWNSREKILLTYSKATASWLKERENFKKFIYFNWRIITLCYDGFCHISA